MGLKAIELRKKGCSINEIANILKIAKSSVSYWVRDVKLTKKQIKNLHTRNPIFNPKLRGSWGGKERQSFFKKLREKYQEEGRNLTRKYTYKKELDFIAGIMLYWAEGHRSNNKNTVRFCNTEASMMVFFVNFLFKYFNVEKKDIRVSIYYHPNGLNINEIHKFWLDKLNLNHTNLLRPYEETKRKISGKRKNIFPYGICTIRIHRTDIIQKIYGAIQEYIGFTKESWNL